MDRPSSTAGTDTVGYSGGRTGTHTPIVTLRPLDSESQTPDSDRDSLQTFGSNTCEDENLAVRTEPTSFYMSIVNHHGCMEGWKHLVSWSLTDAPRTGY